MAAPPSLNIPESSKTVEVYIIDTTAHGRVPTSMFLEEHIGSHDYLEAPCYSFLVKRSNAATPSKYDNLIFDLGVRKDLENTTKFYRDMLAAMPDAFTIEKDVAEILQEQGVDLKSIGGIIWSHFHIDHTGDPSTFPSNTDLIVGPSFKSNFVPAYPTVEDSPVSESAWKGRELVEISFDSALKIGQYKAHDLHGDGSFYLLATPGHTSEHMAALARTKSDPPEFMFLGGDIAHQAGEFRPTEYMPLPDEIRPDPLQKPFVNSVSFCPGHIFSALHPRGSATKPFYTLKVKDGIHVDGAQAQATVDDMQAFDAHENIFVAIAHDHSLKDVYDYFPKSANGWKEKGWKKEGRWRFLAEFGTGSKE